MAFLGLKIVHQFYLAKKQRGCLRGNLIIKKTREAYGTTQCVLPLHAGCLKGASCFLSKSVVGPIIKNGYFKVFLP